MIQVRLAPELIAAIDTHRGGRTRQQYVSAVLAVHFQMPDPVRPQGRPRAAPEDPALAEQTRLTDIIAVIGRDDDAYRRAWIRRLSAAHDAHEALGHELTPEDIKTLVYEHMSAYPHYHPPGSY